MKHCKPEACRMRQMPIYFTHNQTLWIRLDFCGTKTASIPSSTTHAFQWHHGDRVLKQSINPLSSHIAASISGLAVLYDPDTSSCNYIGLESRMVAKRSDTTLSQDSDGAKAFSAHIEKAECSSPSSVVSDEAVDDPYAVTSLDPHEDPKNLPTWRKWAMVFILASGAHCTACAAAMASPSGFRNM